jgi:mono/diheme cytochrome c family protein
MQKPAKMIWLCLIAAACGAGLPPGATDANLDRARREAAPGAELYSRECASCHGQRGEGGSRAPAIIGPGALPLYPRDTASSPATTDPDQLKFQAQSRPPGVGSRDAFRTAQDLYNFVSTRMPLPKNRVGTLKSEEYWAIVNFILLAHATKLPEGGVTPSNASTIRI